jgi:hypothetical protein
MISAVVLEQLIDIDFLCTPPSLEVFISFYGFGVLLVSLIFFYYPSS